MQWHAGVDATTYQENQRQRCQAFTHRQVECRQGHTRCQAFRAIKEYVIITRIIQQIDIFVN
jgi:hypothetical protein